MLKVFIGYDEREAEAYEVAEYSLHQTCSIPVSVTPLKTSILQAAGLLTRPFDTRGKRYDLVSQAPQATDFAVSRFLVPMLAHSGWALFVDCDVVFTRDLADLFMLRDPTKAIQVVKHNHIPVETTKMDGVEQTRYPRKNWSSVILWNVNHPGNRRLNLSMVNQWPGRDLHAFDWLADDEIGDLPRCWNWLSGVEAYSGPGIAHLTLGGPWLPNWVSTADSSAGDNLWLRTRDEMRGLV